MLSERELWLTVEDMGWTPVYIDERGTLYGYRADAFLTVERDGDAASVGRLSLTIAWPARDGNHLSARVESAAIRSRGALVAALLMEVSFRDAAGSKRTA